MAQGGPGTKPNPKVSPEAFGADTQVCWTPGSKSGCDSGPAVPCINRKCQGTGAANNNSKNLRKDPLYI
jgi:hypothetical protein